MALKIVQKIRTRSREEWVKQVKDKWIDLRIFVQENGELCFLAAFVLGIFFILFFKLVISLLIVGVLLAFLVWNIAEPVSLGTGTPSVGTDSVNLGTESLGTGAVSSGTDTPSVGTDSVSLGTDSLNVEDPF